MFFGLEVVPAKHGGVCDPESSPTEMSNRECSMSLKNVVVLLLGQGVVSSGAGV